MHTAETLAAFTERVKQAFEAGRIRAPVHLCGGNEDQLIDVFNNVRPVDWVFSTWRSYYHALLHGWPEEEVFQEILAGRAMYLMNRERRFMAGSIVGGMLPIALGVAAGIKRWLDVWAVHEAKEKAKADRLGYRVPGANCLNDSQIPKTVWVFVGDMAATTGLCHEFRRYAAGHDLPIRLVIEDNGYSTDTPTGLAWGVPTEVVANRISEDYYQYTRVHPHVGTGKRVEF